LFRLAWDASASAFAGRQTLYEHYFFGDPVRMAGALLTATDREPQKARVREFLARISSEQTAASPSKG
jgi:4-hydroxyphenylacetate 3-monooxygenase